MQATARKATWVACIVLLAMPAGWAADTHQQIVDLVANMTAYLSQDDADGFMSGIDKNMPGREDLKRQIEGLLLDYDISSSVEPVRDEGSGERRSVDFDWYMELSSKAATGSTLRRRKIIHCELQLEGKRWRIASLRPLSFFSDKPE